MRLPHRTVCFVCTCVSACVRQSGALASLMRSLIRKRATQAADAATGNFSENCTGGRKKLGLRSVCVGVCVYVRVFVGWGGKLRTSERIITRFGD